MRTYGEDREISVLAAELPGHFPPASLEAGSREVCFEGTTSRPRNTKSLSGACARCAAKALAWFQVKKTFLDVAEIIGRQARIRRSGCVVYVV